MQVVPTVVWMLHCVMRKKKKKTTKKRSLRNDHWYDYVKREKKLQNQYANVILKTEMNHLLIKNRDKDTHKK
jgi:hypothetical protein